MTHPRSLWFESHLFADRAGRRARDAAERLGAAVHEGMLEAGDQLARSSPVVAQQFYRAAAAVWELLGAEEFTRWYELGYALLQAEPPNRDAALAYFSVAPRAVAQAGLPWLRGWCARGTEVSALSRKLGATYFESTAGLIDRVDPRVLTVWTREGLRLHGVGGWRGEFLAHAYFTAAPIALPVLSPEEFGAWADLAVAVQSVAKENRYFAALPPALASLSSGERTDLFNAALTLAAANPAAAYTFYTQLPAALRRVRAPIRAALLEVLRCAGTAIADVVAEIVPVIGALVHDIPAAQRRSALELAGGVAREFPRGTVALLRALPVTYDEARPPAVEQWVRRGLAIAAENAEAGLAYFALQSRTSLQVLRASSTAAVLSDEQGLLRKFIQMLSGRPASIRGADGIALRSALEEFPLENEVALPLRIDLFGTHEDNSRLYRFLAAQLAGRREFGTYSATLPAGSDSLLAYLRAPEHPDLLQELFLVAEGFRIARCLARTYPGLAREHREIATRLLLRRLSEPMPAQAALLDALLAWLVSDRGAPLPAALASLAGVVEPCVAPLASPDASVDDALAVAHALTALLAEPGERRSLSGLDALFLDKVSGDALIDPYMDDDDAPPLPGTGPAVPAPPTQPPPGKLPEDTQLQLDPLSDDADASATPLSAEELQRLLEAGADLRMKQGHGEELDGLGLYITDLLGKIPAEQLEQLRQLLQEAPPTDRPLPRRWLEREHDGAAFYYDEWDYHIADYRQRWCRLREVPLDGDAGEFFNRTLTNYATLIPEVRRQFQRIRPEMYRTVRGLEDGEDFDLNAVVSARVDRRARRPPSSKVYVARVREERDVATLFLLDMSASTDEPLQKPPPALAGDDDDPLVAMSRRFRPTTPPRRIIDVTKEALVIMAEALEEIGDAYAIYGFSGHGRNNVEFYLVKSFNESLSAAVKGRIGAIEPKRSTRMGTALRHASEKMAGISSRSRHIILLSDGFPQDFDYGQDRRSNVYGLRDTSAALREAEASGITPFCITVDKAGHDYLREMCDGARYMVIEDISALPRELPKIYQRVVTV